MISTKMRHSSQLPNLSLGRVWIESLFAGAKGWHGSRRFRLRTPVVGTGAPLVTGGQNIKGLLTHGYPEPRRETQVVGIGRPALNTHKFCSDIGDITRDAPRVRHGFSPLLGGL